MGQDAVIGHMWHGNEQLNHLRENPSAKALFTGANGYISSTWLSDRSQAPTWLYSSVSMTLEIFLNETEQGKKEP